MIDIEYSSEALNVKNLFYRVEAIVYVEGDDDIPVWEEIFRKTVGTPIEFEAVGGSQEIQKVIASIESGEVAALAARDADLLSITGKCSLSPKVIYTYGYSVENSLYIAETICQITKNWCKNTGISLADCQKWLNDFGDTVSPLLVADIANMLGEHGAHTVGNNCLRFMRSQESADPCPKKVKAYLDGLNGTLHRASIQAAEELCLERSPASPRYIRGHFLASAVMKFVATRAKTFGRKVHVSSDALYTAALAHFAGIFGPEHPHFEYYMLSAQKALNSLAPTRNADPATLC